MQRLARFIIVHRVGDLKGATTEIPVRTGRIGIVRWRHVFAAVAAARAGGATGIDTTHFAVETHAAIRSALCRAVGLKGHIRKESRQFLLVCLGGLAAAEMGKVCNWAEEIGAAQRDRPGAVGIIRSDRKSVRPGFFRGEHGFHEFTIISQGDRVGGIIIIRAACTPHDEGQDGNQPYSVKKLQIIYVPPLSLLFSIQG